MRASRFARRASRPPLRRLAGGGLFSALMVAILLEIEAGAAVGPLEPGPGADAHERFRMQSARRRLGLPLLEQFAGNAAGEVRGEHARQRPLRRAETI